MGGPLAAAMIGLYPFLLNGFKSFNLLFKALFIFPSQYLFAIGFSSIFSLRRSLSPDWSFNPKKLDSLHGIDRWILSPNTGFSPSLIPSSKGIMRSNRLAMTCLRLQFAAQCRDLNFGLLPVHSPLLGQSLLISFPPLIDMLKFSG